MVEFSGHIFLSSADCGNCREVILRVGTHFTGCCHCGEVAVSRGLTVVCHGFESSDKQAFNSLRSHYTRSDNITATVLALRPRPTKKFSANRPNAKTAAFNVFFCLLSGLTRMRLANLT